MFAYRIYLFLLSTCIFLFISRCQPHRPTNTTTQEILAQIPIEDQKQIETFLQRIMNKDHFAFALFGSKAIATTGYFHHNTWGNLLTAPFDHIRPEAFEAWERHKRHFISQNFIWVIAPLDGDLTCITLINRKKILQVVTQHLSLFRKYLGTTTTPTSLFKKLKVTNENIHSSLNNREDLLGILLGYGQDASGEYQRRKELRQSLSNFNFLEGKVPTSENFSTPKEEYEFLDTNLWVRNKYSKNYWDNEYVYLFAPVLFVNLGSTESQRLIEKYQKDLKIISNFFKDKNFLEVVLTQIHSETPICLN